MADARLPWLPRLGVIGVPGRLVEDDVETNHELKEQAAEEDHLDKR
jgi:hypothetical protein